MKNYHKQAFPLTDIRRFLEPGPIVLLSSSHKGRNNIMTMGWHMMMGFSPALFGCYISTGNRSHDMVKSSEECVINLPTADLVDQVVGVGNCSGADTDKFAEFGFTPVAATLVKAPMIAECYANFECRLFETSHNPDGCLFVWEVVAAHVATSPQLPETLHYRGDGEFMISGKNISRRSQFKPEML